MISRFRCATTPASPGYSDAQILLRVHGEPVEWFRRCRKTVPTWERHRHMMRGLRQQNYSYSKGHVAYHLTTWLNDDDWRALVRIGYELPRTYARRAKRLGRTVLAMKADVTRQPCSTAGR